MIQKDRTNILKSEKFWNALNRHSQYTKGVIDAFQLEIYNFFRSYILYLYAAKKRNLLLLHVKANFLFF